MSATLTAAREYLAMGFSVVPIPNRKKAPAISWKKYQTELPTDADLVEWFGNGKKMNIGIVTGALSGITVVDFDTDQAIEDAMDKGFLTEGPIVKTSKGCHVYCKYVPGHSNFQKREDLPGMDLRGEGGQVVAPPSIHESGHVYAFIEGHGLDQPLPDVPEWILKKTVESKSGFLLPAQIIGNRNDTLFRFACSELERTSDEVFVWGKLQEINKTNCHEPLQIRELESLFKSAVGYHTKSQRNPEWVQELNEEYFVSLEGNKAFVFSERYDPERDRKDLVRFSMHTFREIHNNRLVPVGAKPDGTLIKKPRGSAWLDHEHRRQYEGVMLAPPGQALTEGYYNLWKGYGVEPIKGCWKLMRSHLFYIVCNGNDTNYQYLMGWLATCVQKPSKPAEVAVVMRGGKGTGKGILGVALCKIFGNNAMHISSAKHLVGNFNNHLRSCICLFADESFWAGDKQHESVLKALITEPTLTIESKGVDVISVRNMLHIIMASNSDWVVPATRDERRYLVLDVSDKHAQDAKYFEPLFHERDNGGLSAMLYDLLEYDLSNFKIRDVPQTCALAEQKIQSLDPVQMWWYGRLSDEGAWFEKDGEYKDGNTTTVISIETARLFSEYIYKVGQTGSRRHQETIFGRALTKIIPPETTKKYLFSSFGCVADADGNCEDKRQNHYIFPSLVICRDYFSKVFGLDIDW